MSRESIPRLSIPRETPRPEPPRWGAITASGRHLSTYARRASIAFRRLGAWMEAHGEAPRGALVIIMLGPSADEAGRPIGRDAA